AGSSCTARRFARSRTRRGALPTSPDSRTMPRRPAARTRGSGWRPRPGPRPAGPPAPPRPPPQAGAPGDANAVLEFASAAGARAASLGSAREAAAQYARALRFADALGPDARGGVLD